MNYTKTLREYCLSNVGSIFDVSKMKELHFSMIPYKTLLKIVNRLEEEKLVKKVSKGVYYINERVLSLNETIYEEYVEGGRGMFVGYKLYNQLGVSKHHDDIIEIYTNRLATKHKYIGNYIITQVDVPYNIDVCCLIQSLELIQNGYKIIDKDEDAYIQNMDLPLAQYKEYAFQLINDAKKYNYSTICTLDRKLSKYCIPNKCLETYNKKYPIE